MEVLQELKGCYIGKTLVIGKIKSNIGCMGAGGLVPRFCLSRSAIKLRVTLTQLWVFMVEYPCKPGRWYIGKTLVCGEWGLEK